MIYANDNLELNLMGDRLVVKPVKVNLNSSKLLQLGDEHTDIVSAKVVDVGDGSLVETFKKDEYVFYLKGSGIPFKCNNDDFEIINYSAVMIRGNINAN